MPHRPPSAGEDALCVEMLDDGFDAHLAAVALTFESEPVDQADRVGVQRVDFPSFFLVLAPRCSAAAIR